MSWWSHVPKHTVRVKLRGVSVEADGTLAKAGRHLNQDAILRNQHFKHIEGRRLRILRETAK